MEKVSDFYHKDANGQWATNAKFADGTVKEVHFDGAARPYVDGTTGPVYVDLDPLNEDVPADEPQQVVGSFLWGGESSNGNKAFAFTDIKQMESPTCAFASSLAAVARTSFNLSSGIVLHRFVDETATLFKVRLYKEDSQGVYRTHWVSVLFDYEVKSTDLQSVTPGEYWMTLYQRAYLSLMSETGKDPSAYGNAFRALTGKGVTSFVPNGDARTQANTILSNLNRGIPMVA